LRNSYAYSTAPLLAAQPNLTTTDIETMFSIIVPIVMRYDSGSVVNVFVVQRKTLNVYNVKVCA